MTLVPYPPEPHMQSLTQAAQSIAADPSHSTAPQVNKPAAPVRMVLQRPPRVPKGRRVFYGFSVPDDWFATFYDQRWPKDRDEASVMKLVVVMKTLKRESGFWQLELKEASCRVSNPVPNEDSTYIITVCSTLSSSFKRRPMQCQFDKLKSLIQQEPDWFIDWEPGTYWDSD
ncbi:hypothetical protein DXG03_009583 [Asterophora parasitica]|uniref:Uncharacterized protein n=1 Tax=Asterophora parasitica TaxID=117018 RepID=A0A9P7FY84_9AGAR|nr:hypothetical protein DXG03_009583 [Asterophora parasitica]